MGAAPPGAARAPGLARALLLAAAGLAGPAWAAAGPPACFADDAVSLIGLDRSFLQAPEAAVAPAAASREEADARRAVPGPAASLKAEEVAGFLDEAGIEPTEEEGIRVSVRDQQGRRWQVKADILRPLNYMLGTLCRRAGIREAGAVLMRGETRLNPFLTPELLRMQDGEVLTLVDELAPPPPPPPLTFLAALRSVAAGQARQPPAAAAVSEPGQEGSLRNALRRALLANPARNQTTPVLKKRKKRKAYKSSAKAQAPHEDPRSDPHWIPPQQQEELDWKALKNALHSKEREHHMKYQVPKDDWDMAMGWMKDWTEKPKRKPEEVEKELDRLTKSEDLQIQKEAVDNMLKQANEGLSDNFEPNVQEGQQRTGEDLASPMQKENTEQGQRQEDEKKLEGKGGPVHKDKANENLLHEQNQTEQEFKTEQQEPARVGKDPSNGQGTQPQEEKAASHKEHLQGLKEEPVVQKSLQPELAPSPSQMVPKQPTTPSRKEEPPVQQKSLLPTSPSQAPVPQQPKAPSQKEQPQAHKEEPVEQKSLLAPSPSQATVPEQPKALSQKEQPQGLKEKQVKQRSLQQEDVSSQKQLPQKQKQPDADAKQRREDDGAGQQPQRPKQLEDRERQGEGQQHLVKHKDKLESRDPSEQARTEEHSELKVDPKKKEDKASGTRRRKHEREKAATEEKKAHSRKRSAQEANATGNTSLSVKNASKTGTPHGEVQQQQMLAPNQLSAKQHNSSADVEKMSQKEKASHQAADPEAADPEAAVVDEEEAPEPARFRAPAPSYESWIDNEGVQSPYRAEVGAPEAEKLANSTGTGDAFMKPLAELTPSEQRQLAERRAAAALDCVLSDWSDWSACRKVRDDGMRVRYSKRWRQVIQPQRPGGKICPSGLISSRACLTKDTLREIRGLAELAYWPVELVDELLGNGAGGR